MAFKPKVRSPKALGDVLERTLGFVRTAQSGTKLSDKMRDYAVFPLWPELVGEEIAAVSRPEKILKRTILVIRVIDAAWMQELTLQKREILERIQKVETGARISDIRFLAGDPKSVG